MSHDLEFLDSMREWVRIVTRHSMHGFIRYAKDNGLSMSQTAALFKIKRNGVCGVADIGEDLQVSSAAASQMLERLVQQGFIERSENPEDRRGKRLSLTEKGQKLLQESIYARQRWIEDLYNSLSPEEMKASAETIEMLVRKTKSLDIALTPPHHCHGKGIIHS